MVVESGTTSDLASQSLELVNRELSSTLDAARREIESYVDGQAGNDALLRAAGMLHLAAGALKIVEVHGAAMLAEEMEQTCRTLPDFEDRTAVERGVEALTRAMVQLPAYLERLLSGGRDVALVLLPLLNDLREARNRPQLSEGTMLLLGGGPFDGTQQAAAEGGAQGPELTGRGMAPKAPEKALLAALRARFEALGDPETAKSAQAYMKSAMPFHGVKTAAMSLDEAIERVQAMHDAAKRVNPNVIVLCHGGPIATPDDARYVLERTRGVDGFFGASSIERLAAETAIESQARRFKSIRVSS